MAKQNKRLVDMSTGTRPKASKGKRKTKEHQNKYKHKKGA